MSTKTEEFVRLFHSLTGTTVSERRKHLFYLLETVKQSASQQEIDFSSIKPTNHLEESFKLDVLIYFRRIPELAEVLKSENPNQIKKILKQEWFCVQAFENVTAQELIEAIFPHLSFSSKAKILNKLSQCLKNTEQAGEFFEAIHQKYGLFLATKILPACSLDLILNSIKAHRVNLTCAQILGIVKLYPECIESLLEELKEYNYVEGEYLNIFLHVASINPVLFFKLFDKYRFPRHVCFGRSVTKKLLLANKNALVKDSGKYAPILKKTQIYRILKDDYNQFYLNVFPKEFESFPGAYVYKILQAVPQKHQLNLLLNTFEQVYNKKFEDCSSLITTHFVQMLPMEEKEKWVLIKYGSKDMVPEDWIYLLKPESSFPLLKKLISVTSDMFKRRIFVAALVTACKNYDDQKSLKEACKYVLGRHRNDDKARNSFLHRIHETFEMHKLDAQCWEYINEIIQLFELNKEDFPHNTFLIEYIHYRLFNGLPAREQVKKLTKICYQQFNILKKTPAFEKTCLEIFADVIPEEFTGKDLQDADVSFLVSIMNWNNRHPENTLSLFSYKRAASCLNRIVEKGDDAKGAEKRLIIVVLRMKGDDLEIQNLRELYFKRFKRLDNEVLLEILQVKPLLFSDNIDKIIKQLVQLHYDTHPLLIRLRNYSHLEIPQKITSFCLGTLNTPVAEHKNECIQILSYFLEAIDFINLIKPYYPIAREADAKTEEGRALYNFQEGITKVLENLEPPWLAFEPILQFCKGDYLKLVQRPLYRVCHNAAEKRLSAVLNEIAGRAVSVRKHAIYLACKVMPKDYIYALLSSFQETEKNASIWKFIFKESFKLFVNNPNDTFWELIKLNMGKVDVEDPEALDALLQMGKIPDDYVTRYIIFTWGILETVPKKEQESRKIKFLCSIKSEVVAQLPSDFCEQIIKPYFFTTSQLNSVQRTIHTFTCKYIIFSTSEIEKGARLEKMFVVVRAFVNLKPISDQKFRSLVYHFMEEFCTIAREKKDKILFKFSELWTALFKPIDEFDEYLFIRFSIIHLGLIKGTSSGRELSTKVAETCDEILNSYGTNVLIVFYKALQDYLYIFFEMVENYNRYIFAKDLLNASPSVNCLLLSIYVLGSEEPSKKDEKAVYNEVIELLKKKPEPFIHILLQRVIRTGTLSD